MKQFFFAVAVVALSAVVSLADETPVAPAPAPVGPIVTASPVPMYYESAQPARRGIFGRLRNRGNTTTYSTPVMTAPPVGAPIPVPAATPMPPVTQPQPMPGVKPAGGVSMNPGMIMQATSTTLPPGIYTTTDGTVVQVGGTMSMSSGMMNMTTGMPMQSTTTSTRTGLFGRRTR